MSFQVDRYLSEIPNESFDKPATEWHWKKHVLRKQMLQHVIPSDLAQQDKTKMHDMTKEEAMGVLEALEDGMFQGSERRDVMWAEISSDFEKVKETAK